ncbi:MAG TPA: hypothetical protein VHW01_13095 [Polyangiaceae bacterium]|jgi:hypothetical protein|nr:hypothetical protein [Polyangiaceae bacterium]
MLAFGVACVGCSLSVGAGAAARVGRRPADPSLYCDGFETCDVAYQRAVARARRCAAADSDCESEEADVTASYQALREQTYLELDALRSNAQQAAQELAALRSDCPAPASRPK